MGSFKPNEYGLFDVPGNGVRIGITVTVLRVGSWDSTTFLRVARRSYNSPNDGGDIDGFRCVVSGSDYP